MAPERSRSGAWHVDENNIDRCDRRISRVGDDGKEIRALQPPLIGDQSLEPSERFVAGDHSTRAARKLQRLSARSRAQIGDRRSFGYSCVFRHQRRRRILDEEQTFLECTELSERCPARDGDAVARVRCLGDVHARRLHRRLELLAHYPKWPDDYRRLGVVQCQQSLGVLLAPALDPARYQPTRMRILERERFDRVRRRGWSELLTLAIGASQHGIDQLARAESVSALGELDCLSDGGVGRHTSHVEQLINAESQQVYDVRIETNETAADSFGENRVDNSAVPEHPVHQLARPAAVTRVERTDASLERLIEKFSATQIDADFG